MTGKSKQSSSQTSTLNNWSKDQYDQLAGQVKGLLGGSYQPYTGDLSADPNAMQAQAGQSATGLLNFTPDKISASSFKDADLSGYMNPYIDEVLNRGTADLDRARLMMRSSAQDDATAAGAWNGAAEGIAKGEADRAFLDSVTDLSASTRANAFNQAASLFNQDRAAQMQADLANQSAGMQGAQFQLGAAGLLGQLGAQDRQFDQGALDRQYGEFLRGQDDPFKRSQALLGLLGATPMLTNTSGTTTQKSGTPWGQIIGTGLQAAAMFSDARLKENVAFVETDAAGRRWYDFTYRDDPERTVHRGVMAQDLLAENPNHPAVSTKDGFYVVDYGKL